MSQRRSLVCAFVAVALCLAMALAGSMHLSAAFADEGAPVGDSAPAIESANPEVTGTGDSQAPAEGGDPSLNNESSAPQGGESGAPAGDNGDAGTPIEGTGSEGENVPAGDAVTGGEGASSDGTPTDSASNADGTVNGPASSSAADSDIATVAAGDESTVADGSTLTGYEGHLNKGAVSTQNIGRIWVDKTVQDGDITLSGDIGDAGKIQKGDSDFLVGLSALSSMSSITTEAPKPLDIVLLLDMSGSMSKSFDEANPYEEIDGSLVDPDSGTTYYVKKQNGEYQYLSRYANRWYYYESYDPNNPKPSYVSPLGGSGSDTKVQFYVDKDPKINALKDAVDSFIDATAAENDKIDDANLQHRISVVKFSGDISRSIGNETGKTQIVSDFAAYNTDNAQALKDTINSLRPSGATRADFGMQLAQDQVNQANRADSQKVVIFFTDGEPNDGTGFVDEIANSAIKDASAMNAGGTLVYTIGVFEGADANQTDWREESAGKFNAYMNAMSSKYPYAQSYQELGDRVGTREYYKVAEDKEGLAQVFQEITGELKTETSESPVVGGAGDEQGYVTFSDELGQYMEVDSFKSIVFAGKQFTDKTEETAGNVTTYTFSRHVEDTTGIYPDGNLSEIIIQVEKDPSNLAQGDKVTVKIPANLIPLRNYSAKVSREGIVSDFKVSEAYPIRVFYGVSLKDKAAEAIENGTADTALQEYIKANTSKTTDAAGKEHNVVSFLSNLYEKDKTGISGSTTAQFTPAETNTYYYVDVNTPLYVDKECKIRLTEASYNESKTDTLYYKQSFYQENVNHLLEEVVAFPVATFAEGASGFVEGNEQDGYYLKAGSPRLSRITEFQDEKGEQVGGITLGADNTGTAELVANPNWNSRRADASYITVQLGNNGKLSKELPGTLKVSKSVTVDEGLNAEQFKDAQFPFEVSIPAMAGKTVQAKVVATVDGTVISDLFAFKFDENGKYTQSLKNGETLVITGLSDGAAYTVTEGKPVAADGRTGQKGFTQTAPVDSNGAATPATGTISSSAEQAAAFTNNYSVNPVTVGDAFKGEKKLMGRDWLEGDEFTFVIDSHEVEGTPMPNPSKITLTKADADKVEGGEGKSVAFAFEGVQYTKPGIYEYDIYEDADAEKTRLPGVTYTNANYHVTVQVTDNGQGELVPTVTVKRDAPDLGDNGAICDIPEGQPATFTNVYDEETIASAPQGSKVYTNNGSKPLEDGMFTFKVTPQNGAPMPADFTPAEDDSNSAIVTHQGSTISLPQPTFDNSVNGAQYSYLVQEVIPSSANADNNYTVDGMTYDPNVYMATVTITVDEHGVPSAAWKYYNADGTEVKDPEDENKAANRLYFYNSYASASTTASIGGSKTLTGRDMKTDANDSSNNETFGFTLTATAETQAKGGFELPANVEKEVSGGTKGHPVDFAFDDITFTRPGTYVFNVNETKWNGEALPPNAQDGLTFDTHTSTVTIEVKDDGKGKLYVEADGVKYDNGPNAATNEAAFTNKYETSATFAGIDVTKTMTGRAMNVGEFSFVITPANDNAKVLGIPADSAKFSNTLANRSETFKNKLSGLKFTQEDAGKTFDYIVEETGHNDDGTGPSSGVTYDTARYYVSINVQDDGNGHLTATPTIKLADANGKPTGDMLEAITFTNKYEATASDEVTPVMNKRLDGRSWTADDRFTFKIEKSSAKGASGVTDQQAWDAMPSPASAEKTLNEDGSLEDAASGANVPFDFGSLSFTKAGTYTYKVTEVIPEDATNAEFKNGDGSLIAYKDASPDQQKKAGWEKDGLTYTNYVTTITINVTDSGTGKLQVGQPTVSTGLFINRYAASQSLDDAVNFELTKTLNGHDMADRQFSFKVEAVDAGDGGATAAETAAKIGISNDGSVTSVEVFGKGGTDGVPTEMLAGSQQMRFTQVDSGKKFVVQFSEVQKTAEEAPGYTYDQTIYQMEVTPTDNGNGTMTIHTVLKKIQDAEGNPVAADEKPVFDETWNGGDKGDLSVDFVNKYESAGTIALSGTKTIVGPLTSGSAGFEFTVEQAGDAAGGAVTADTVKAVLPNPATATSDTNGNFTFGDITFSKPGTYYFKVAETNSGIPGVGYDDNAKIVTVNAVEADGGNGNGVLNAAVADGSPDLAFINTYTLTASVPYVPTISKTVSGHAATAGQFSFQLIAADDATEQAIANKEITDPNGAELAVDQNTGVVETVANKAAIADGGTEKGIAFSGLVFNKVVEGPGYNFIVKEAVEVDDDAETSGTQNAGWTMDTHEYKINITVKDEASRLTVVPTYNDAEGNPTSGTFSNTFGAATTLGENGGLNVTKELKNRTLEAEQFDFTIGVANDSENYDDALAKLQQAGGDKFDAASGKLSFSNGALDATGKAVMQPLNSLAFDQDDIGKMFTYMVSESTAGYSPEVNGYTPDMATFKVEITVLEGENGKICTSTKVTEINDGVSSEPVVSDGSKGEVAVAPFVNSYAADGSTTVEATKTLDNRDMVDGEFEFGVAPQGSAQDGTADVATAKNGADGKISFTINYTIEQLNKLVADKAPYVTKNTDGTWTLRYTAYEKKSLPEGVTAEKASFDFTVTVKDDGDGTLTATPTYATPGTTNTFENTYGKVAKASASIAATKTLHGRGQQDGEFKFSVRQGKADANGVEVLTGVSTAGEMDAATKVMFTGKAEGAAAEQGVLGEYTFESLAQAVKDGWAEYNADNKTWTLHYSISELTDPASMPAGVQVTTDHPDYYDFMVTVVDDGKGGLTAATHYPQDDKNTFDFDNTYGQGANATTPVAGTKTLAGEFASALDITGKYTFTLVNEDGSEVTEHKADGFVASATNPDKNGGSVTLGSLVFTMDDIKDVAFGDGYTRSKTFTYKVTETETNGAVPGVTNDADAGADKGKTVIVTLTDDGKGNLTATATGFEFVNTYAPGTVTNTPVDVTKKLTGDRPEGLQGGEFEFEMSVAAKDGSPTDGFTMPGGGANPQVMGNAASTATEGDNANVGAVEFGNITFTKPGTYTVTVTEKVPAGDKMQPFMEYNVGNNTYSYDVEVRAGGATLTAGIVEGSVNGSPQFVNNYEKPEKSVSELPEDGIQVGDELTYTIEWANTTSAAAKIVVSDELTQGLAYVDGSQKVTVGEGGTAATVTPDGFKAEGQNLSWEFNAGANTSGTVTFKAKVTEDALTIKDDNLNNKATVAVGNSPSVETDVVPVPKPKTGYLTISKAAVSSDAGVDAPAQDFTFSVELKDKNDDTLTGEYNFKGTSDGVTAYSGKVSNGGTIVLKDKGSVTIEGLPGGATYRVVETTLSGWTASFGNAGDKGTIAADRTATVAVTNTYTPGSTSLAGADSLKVQKVLEGRDWLANEKYTFEISAVTEDAPLPESTTLELGKPAKGNAQDGNFGNIAFSKTGEYEYKIVETGTSADKNLTFSQAEYKVVVTVDKDAADPSKLAVSSVMTQVKDDEGEAAEAPATVEAATFTNTYKKSEQTKDVSKVDAPATSINGQLVGVGDELTYAINWANDAVNDKGEAVAAAVTVRDKVPEGTKLVDGSAGFVTDAPEGSTVSAADDGTITWVINNAPAGAAGTVSFRVMVTEDAVNYDSIKNTASVKVGNNDPKSTTETENFVPKKEETTNPGSIEVGQELQYKISFKNAGAVTNATVVDKLSDGLVYKKGSAQIAIIGGAASGYPQEPNEANQTLTWDLSDLPAGADVTITFSVTVTRDALTTVDNQATVNGHNSNVVTTPVPADNAKHVEDASGIDIDGKLVGVGDVLTYKIDWANGDTDGTVTIVDTLPEGVSVEPGSISDPGELSEDGKTITWVFESQPAGKRDTVSFQATVTDDAAKPGDIAELTNQATVNGAEVSVSNYVPGKSATAGEGDQTKPAEDIQVGQLLTYTIAYKNTEATSATVTITDKVPAGTEFVDADPKVAPDSEGNLAWTIEGVEPDGFGTVSFTVRVTKDAVSTTDPITNQATIKVGDNDPDIKTNTTTTEVTSGPLTISKTVKPYREGLVIPEAAAGQAFTFTIELADVNGNPITGSFAYTGAAADGVQGGAVDFAIPEGGKASVGTIALKAGQSITFTALPKDARVKVTETPVKDFVVSANPQATDITGETDLELAFTNTYTGEDINTKDVVSTDDPTIDMNGQLVGVGSKLTYQVNWVNDAVDENGMAAAATVTVTDVVPSGTKLVEDEAGNPIVPEGAKYDAATRTLTWEIKADANATGTVSFNVVVTDDAVNYNDITNQATITIGENSKQTNIVTNDFPKKTVNDKPQVEGDIQVGDELTYTIEWANTTGEAADVVITDALPAGLTFLEASDGGSFDKDANTVTWALGNKKSGDKGSVTIRVAVNDKALVPNADNSNKATIQIGDDVTVGTNTVPGPKISTGSLTISKTVVSSDAGVDAPGQEFAFKLVLKDKNDQPLSNAYSFAGTSDGEAEYAGEVSNGSTVKLKSKGSVTIEGLPAGASYEVTEETPDGWTASFAEPGNSGTINADAPAAVAVTNTYTPASVSLTGASSLKVQKVLEGRDWLQDEKYTFEISAVNPTDAPMPERTTLELGKPVEGNAQTGNFGDISFAKTGAYEYKIVEMGKSADGNLAFSQAEYKVVVTVDKDAADPSKLAVSSVMTQVLDDKGEATEAPASDNTASFTNTYTKPDQKKDVFAGGDTADLKTSVNGQLVGVGDLLTYKIDWVNTAVNEDGTAAGAAVTITDGVPEGTELAKNEDGTYVNVSGASVSEDERTLTWTLLGQDPNASGTVSFTVRVTDDAVSVDKIENKAAISINGKVPDYTNEVENDFPKKTVETPNPEGGIQVGDVLTYTVEWANTTGDVADVVVSDAFMKGLTLLTGDNIVVTGANPDQIEIEAKAAAPGDDSAATPVRVTIRNVEAGASGTVIFKVRVNEDAVTVDELTNTATITVGDKSSVTNTTHTAAPKSGNLSIAKNIASSDQGVTAPADDTFNFVVELKDAHGETLTGSYDYVSTEESAHQLEGTISSAKDAEDGTGLVPNLTLQSGDSVVITGLPGGSSYRVTEVPDGNYRTTYASDQNEDTSAGTIATDQTSAVVVTNIYAPDFGMLTGETDLQVQKMLTGRDWQAQETYSFELSKVSYQALDGDAPETEGGNFDEMPLPESTTLELGKPTEGNVQTGNFGNIGFGRVGIYTYQIVETGESADANLVYSKAVYQVVVTVSDADDDGTLEVTSKMVQLTGDQGEEVGAELEGHTAVFTNTYVKPDQKKDVSKAENPTASVDGQLVGVGDELTYTINWVNDAVNDEGKAATATVTIADNVPAGTEFVSAENDGKLSDDGKTVTWNLGEQSANASGTVSFTVRVTDDAVNYDDISNTATITIGGHNTETNTVTNDFPKKTVDGKPQVEGDIQVGDELVYTIEWANTTGSAATVTVTDVLPAGLTFLEASDGGVYEGNVVTWQLADKAPGESGTVTVRVSVNDNAVVPDADNSNKATIEVGDSTISTNTVPDFEPKAGDAHLVINKQVSIEAGQGIDEAQARAKEFNFVVSLVDAAGQPVTGEYGFVKTAVNSEGEREEGTLVLGLSEDETFSSGTVTLRDGQSIEIAGLPSGSTYTVTEDPAAGYETFVPAYEGVAGPGADATMGANVITGTLSSGQAIATANFLNHYSVSETTLDGAANLAVTKVFEGREWTEGDAFVFTLGAADETAAQAIEAGTVVMPANAGDGIAITKATTNEAGMHVAAFGDITFKQAGTFTFAVTEQRGELGGVTYDETPRVVTVVVKDNGDGTLIAAVESIKVTSVDGETVDTDLTFTNTYAAGEAVLDTNANALFTKSFAGKAWDSERFGFEIEAQGDAPTPENTQTEVTPESPTAPAGDAAVDEGMGTDNANATKSFGFGTITFSDANMRDENGGRVFEKEFAYKVWENHPADAKPAEDLGTDEQGNPLAWDASDGITYDGHTATLVVTVTDDGQGNLSVSGVSVSEGNFSNLAEAKPVATGGVLVQKTLTGRDMEQGQFSFTLAADDALSADRLGIPMVDAGGMGFSMPAAADGTPVQLDVTTLEALANRFNFTREDAGNTYSFTVAENLPEGATAENNYTLDGYTYDVTRYGVSFTVSVDEQGAMTVRALATNLTTGATVLDQTVAEGQALPTIVLPYTNTYKAGAIITDDVEGAAKLEATKTLAGRPQLDGEFSFEVVDEAGNVVATASSTQAGEGEPGALTFSDIKYTLTHGELEGLGDVTYVTDGHTNAPANSNGEYTFVYTLTELTAAGSLPSGVTPDDPSSFTVVVMLTDNGDGTLAAQVSYPDIDGIPAFHNTYAGDVVAQAAINGSKAVKGLPEGTYLESGDFSFTMTPLTEGDSNAEATVAVKVPAGSTANEGTFSFPLTYTTDDLRDVEPVLGEDGVTQTRTKVFTYAISEVNSRQFGVHYDDALYFVDVTLTDHGDGSLTATVSNVWPENGEPIDPTTGIVFTNVYDESAIQWTPQGLKATHAEEGVGLAGKTFGFVVTDAMGNRVSSGVSGANGDITFAPITLPGEGTHYYTIYELRSGAQGGITYDATTYTLELTVEPDGNGTYSFTAVYTNDVTGEVVDKAYFTNEYASVGTSIDLSATKTITAPHTAAGFRFAVVDDATGEQVATGASDANGAVAFNTIYYSYGETTVALPSVAGLTGEAATAALASANLAASVVEGDAAPSAEQAGLVYKAIANGVEVVAGTPVPTSATVDLYVYGPYVEQAVTPDPMTPSDDVATGDDAANTEPGTEPGTDADAEPVTPVEPNAGATGTEPSLPIEPDAPVTDEAADAVEPTEPVAEPSSELPAEPAVAAAVGPFAPSVAIADDQDVAPYVGEAPAVVAISSTDLGDHWYTIYEINDGQDGVTYDGAYYRVRVTVTDNGNGTMSAAVTKVERTDADGIITGVTLEGANGMASVVFANEYKANHPTTATLEGTKTLTGRDANAGEFTFAVTDAATGAVVAGGQSEAAKNGQTAPIAFGTLHFSEAGEYDYVVSEAKGGQEIAGVTYDASAFAVHVSVVDNGDGTLTATVSYPDGPVAFENAYKAAQGTEATLEGTKTLTGRDANAGEFGFVVTDGSGTMVGTGQSAAAAEGQPAKIVFSKLHFSEPGEYLYTVSEVGAGQTLAGITFDTTQLRVKVVVTDNLDGTLSAQVEYLDGPIAFRNAYGATGGEGSTVVPQATKTLTGRELRAGEFTFALKDMATGEVVSTATNAADGTVTFPALRYEQAGEHEYAVFEVAGREEGMTYDASTYRLQVGVTDDGKGRLIATATYPDGTPSFQNSYERPEEPEPPMPDNPDTPDNPGTPGGPGEPDIPKTGDPTGPLALVSAVMGTLVLGGAGVLVRRKLRIQK